MNKVLKLLKENGTMSLATSCGDRPRSSVVDYIMVGDSLIFMTDRKTLKAKNLSKNPNISLTVVSALAEGQKIDTLLYLAADGVAVAASAEETDGYNKGLIKRYPEFKQFIESGAMDGIYFKAVLDTVWFSCGMAPAEVIKMK